MASGVWLDWVSEPVKLSMRPHVVGSVAGDLLLCVDRPWNGRCATHALPIVALICFCKPSFSAVEILHVLFRQLRVLRSWFLAQSLQHESSEHVCMASLSDALVLQKWMLHLGGVPFCILLPVVFIDVVGDLLLQLHY